MTTETTIIDRKEIVKQLDRAAERADYAGATPKQTWFLAGLLEQRGEDADSIGCGWADTSARLTKAEASKYIDFLLNGRA